MIKIRSANRGDVIYLEHMDKFWKKESISKGFVPRTRRGFIKIINQGAIVVVAEENGKLIGYVCGVIKKARRASANEKKYYLDLDSAYMLKTYRNRGVGKLLVRKLIAMTRKKDIDTVWVTADSTELQRLIDFYKSLGFKESYVYMKLKI